MLSPDELKEALQDAVKGAEKCTRFCVHGSRIEGGAYHLFHNGTGNRDTDVQPIFAPGMLGLSKGGLTEKLRAWITDLHSGNKIDLNATMATGETGAAVQLSGGAFWTSCYRLDHLHLHKEGSCSLVAS